MWDLLQQYLSWKNVESFIRAGLMALGGGLVASGKMDPEQLTTIVGSIMGIIGVAWSYIEHKPTPAVAAPKDQTPTQ
jgi:hypothetical protein